MTSNATRGAIILGLAGVALWAMTRTASAAAPAPDDLEPLGPEPEPEPEETFDPHPSTPAPRPDRSGVFTSVSPGPTTTHPTPSADDLAHALTHESPTVGAFYQVRRGDTFLGMNRQSIVYQALLAFARGVAAENNLDDSWAKTFASTHRVHYLDLVLCSGWNDVLYGTFGYGAQAHPGPHGRTIRLLRDHADNRSRLLRGLMPVRNIAMGKPGDGGKGTGVAVDPVIRESYEFLWLPALSKEAALRGEATTLGATWPDGSSAINPPPEILDLGIDMPRDPGLKTYGCITTGGDGVLTS